MRRRRPPGPAPAGSPVPLSVTVDTLPPGETYRVYDTPTPHGTRPLLVVALGVELAHLGHTYDRTLTGELRPLVWRMGQVPDPAADPDGYQRARWWTDDLIVDMVMVRRMEAAGLVYPWPHHGTYVPAACAGGAA